MPNEHKVHKITLFFLFFPFEKANNWLYLGNNNRYLKLDEQIASEEFQTIVKVEKEEDDDFMQSKQRRKTCKL